jgi:hypothetical protein
MRRIFWGFCINWFLIDPLHCLSSRSDISFEFAEIFVIEKRLPDSPSRGVDDSPNRTYAEQISAKTPENPPHCHVPLMHLQLSANEN